MKTALTFGICLGTLITFPILAAQTRVESTVNGHVFSLPPGFTIELVAGSGMVSRPVSGSFDDRGRLYVTESSGTAEAPSEQLKHPSHRILRLEDTNGDGKFDRTVVFAEHVMFPQGCLWYQGSVYVAGPPSLWRYTDKNDDGIADEAIEWWKGGTLTGCANDLHGPTIGPDGYLYWTKGAFAEQTHPRPGRPTIHDRAAHIYRAKPDGTELELVMSGGMDNPVEIAFGPDGETFFTSTFIDFTEPGRRDGIAHAVYGGVYGKVNHVLEDGLVKRASPELLPVMTQFGPGAACGLCQYQSTSFGSEYQDNLFATTFNLHKVTRHVLHPAGASYRTEDEDFLTCPDVDFHPTDVLECGDGSLLVIDTGGWYKLCCPSSQLAKPDVLGGIYRIRKTGAVVVSHPTGGLPAHREGDYWRFKQAGLHRQASALEELKGQLARFNADPKNADPALTRVAAEALGRIGDVSSAPALLDAAGRTDDPFLSHSLVFALIEINAADPCLEGLKSASPGTRRAALMALDQMDSGRLGPEQVSPLLEVSDDRLRFAAEWVLRHHSSWAPQLAEWFQNRLSKPDLSLATRTVLEAQLQLFANSTAEQPFLGRLVLDSKYPDSTRKAALSAIASASTEHPPEPWTESVISVLGHAESLLTEQAIQAADRLSKQPAVAEALRRYASRAEAPSSLRLDALRALPPGSSLTMGSFNFLTGQLAPANPALSRGIASDVIGRSMLSGEQLTALLSHLGTAGPLELGKLLAAYDVGGDETLGRGLLMALKASKAAQAQPLAQLRTHFAKFPEATRTEAESFLVSLHQDAAQQARELDSLLSELSRLSGDLNRGQALFNGPKAACATCHKIGYLGGEVGPELTKIGEVRTERDLLESIVYPSASFVRSYEPTSISLKDGDSVNGIVRRESPEEIEVVTGPGPTRRIRRSEIADLQPGVISVMPAGMGDALSRQELADILKFVKTVRWR